jgi:hypothetical protein
MSTQAAAEQIEAHMESYWSRQQHIPHGDAVLADIRLHVNHRFVGMPRDRSSYAFREFVRMHIRFHWPSFPVEKLGISFLYDEARGGIVIAQVLLSRK